MTNTEIIANAIGQHPDCSYGEVQNGLTALLQVTRIVNLWRNEECYLANDPPRYAVEGYPRD